MIPSMFMGIMKEGSKCSVCGKDLSNIAGIEICGKDYCDKCVRKEMGWE